MVGRRGTGDRAWLRGVSIPLNRINNVNFDQSLIARLLNNGIVTIESAGETGDSVFENIRDPEHVRGVIFQQVQADEQADSERDAAALAQVMQQRVPPAEPSTLSTQERLHQLNELRNAGLVSDEEFARKRAEILTTSSVTHLWSHGHPQAGGVEVRAGWRG